MADISITHQTALAIYEGFKRLPLEVRKEVEVLILKTKKSKRVFLDDTDYLLRDENNIQSIKKSIENVDLQRNLTEYSPDEWNVFVNETLQKVSK